MKQALVKRGRVIPVNVPAPVVSAGSVLIKVVNSCISAGTELAEVAGSGKSLIRRALEQPENIRKVLNMVKSDGIAETYAKVMGRLETSTPTGYSVSGVVIALGEGVKNILIGDRVAAGGGGIANHAEYVDVPMNLITVIPDSLDFPQASTVAIGSIAMQGIRRANLSLGEFTVVFGVGILGQLTVQMLAATGIRVIAIDLDDSRLSLAQKLGAEKASNPEKEDAVKAVMHLTGGHGADSTIFCAATNNPKSLSMAFEMTRKKGRLVMVGVWGTHFNRADIYKKEIDFLISTSYGPGRYDASYEDRGIDYPYAYVRWTENRNMAEYLRLLALNKIDLSELIQAVFPIDRVEEAFNSLKSPDRPLMVLLDYGKELPKELNQLLPKTRKVDVGIGVDQVKSSRIRVGLIGTGSFATSVHLPNLKKLSDKYETYAICDSIGSVAKNVAEQFGAKYATTDYNEILSDQDVDLLMICTRHNLHGEIVLKSLQSGKHTFVEKPLCTTQQELDAIKAFYGYTDSDPSPLTPHHSPPLLMVGFNRHFSKYAQEIKKHVQKRINPLFIHYRMNAGFIPLDHWVHTEEGGGRIIGEACHIIDLFSYLIDSPVKAYAVSSLKPKTLSIGSSDNKSITFEYEDGSVAVLDYFAIGSKALAKEYLEIHFDEKSIVMNDYKSITGYGLSTANLKYQSSEKGHIEELEFLAKGLNDGNSDWPINLTSMFETTELTLNIA